MVSEGSIHVWPAGSKAGMVGGEKLFDPWGPGREQGRGRRYTLPATIP